MTYNKHIGHSEQYIYEYFKECDHLIRLFEYMFSVLKRT